MLLSKIFSHVIMPTDGARSIIDKDAAQFLHLVDIETRIVPATLRNRAGIIGAAVITSE